MVETVDASRLAEGKLRGKVELVHGNDVSHICTLAQQISK